VLADRSPRVRPLRVRLDQRPLLVAYISDIRSPSASLILIT
jgi:hypothetical protein